MNSTHLKIKLTYKLDISLKISLNIFNMKVIVGYLVSVFGVSVILQYIIHILQYAMQYHNLSKLWDSCNSMLCKSYLECNFHSTKVTPLLTLCFSNIPFHFDFMTTKSWLYWFCLFLVLDLKQKHNEENKTRGDKSFRGI